MLERLKTLSNLSGVSGNESAIRAYIKPLVAPYADEVFTDSVGNLYAHKKGVGPRVMLAAHMDEVGMIVTGISEKGTLVFAQCGIDSRVLVSKRVAIGPDKIPGVIGAKAIHMQKPEERTRALSVEELYIDIGATDKADAEKSVHPGDYISFVTECASFGKGLIKGKALDDRVGCAILTELIKNDYACDLWTVFTVQEELGCRGATVAANRVKPDVAIVFEGTTANDVALVPSHKTVTTVGAGAAISIMDRGTVFPQKMIRALTDAAKRNGIPWQLRKGNAGGNDAGAIHKSMAGVVCGGLSVPCRYIHSPVSVAAESDVLAVYRLADTFLKEKLFEEVL